LMNISRINNIESLAGMLAFFWFHRKTKIYIYHYILGILRNLL
jgi:hypothetical protein